MKLNKKNDTRIINKNKLIFLNKKKFLRKVFSKLRGKRLDEMDDYAEMLKYGAHDFIKSSKINKNKSELRDIIEYTDLKCLKYFYYNNLIANFPYQKKLSLNNKIIYKNNFSKYFKSSYEINNTCYYKNNLISIDQDYNEYYEIICSRYLKTENYNQDPSMYKYILKEKHKIYENELIDIFNWIFYCLKIKPKINICTYIIKIGKIKILKWFLSRVDFKKIKEQYPLELSLIYNKFNLFHWFRRNTKLNFKEIYFNNLMTTTTSNVNLFFIKQFAGIKKSKELNIRNIINKLNWNLEKNNFKDNGKLFEKLKLIYKYYPYIFKNKQIINNLYLKAFHENRYDIINWLFNTLNKKKFDEKMIINFINKKKKTININIVNPFDEKNISRNKIDEEAILFFDWIFTYTKYKLTKQDCYNILNLYSIRLIDYLVFKKRVIYNNKMLREFQSKIIYMFSVHLHLYYNDVRTFRLRVQKKYNELYKLYIKLTNKLNTRNTYTKNKDTLEQSISTQNKISKFEKEYFHSKNKY